VAIAPPPPPRPDEKNLSDHLMFYLEVHEDCVVASSNWAERARYTLGVPFVTWTPAEAESLR
ncbi:MAG: hypothetical protein M3032_01640, partial [Verrucomicrobiota bacterium]|nr:hypothetical protein [Verrucomicrobiota bacterium]